METTEEVLEELNLKKNRNVRKPLGRIPAKSTVGRKRRFSPTKMRNSINRYFDKCEEEDNIPSVKGLMLYLDMTSNQFYVYAKYPEFEEMMERAKMIISNWIETDIYQTNGMAAGKIAYAKNVHGWSDKIDTNSTVTKTVITIDQARAKIEMLAPKILEMMKNNNLVNQLVIDVTPEQAAEKVEKEKKEKRRI